MDNDPLATRSTYENCELNQISPERINIQDGSIEQVIQAVEQPVDGIVCNILAEVIIDLIPQFNAISKKNTWAILSGILMDQAKPIADALEQQGWVVATLWRRQDWCCFNIRRS